MTTKLTPQQFVQKWSNVYLKETAVSQSHFNDLCALVGHPTPIEHDPSGKNFSFETQTLKPDGAKGFADVYYRDRFIWEYKGPHKDLDKAYQQLQLYREDLDNPPLLITSDIHTIHIHTNFTGYPSVKHTLTLSDLAKRRGLQKLQWAFYTPEKLRPRKTQQTITKATADTLLAVANEMKQHRDVLGKDSFTNEQLAHFLVRLLFSLFAEDMGLLPVNLFTQIVKVQGGNYTHLHNALQELFTKMHTGGTFGMWPIRHFNGTLFNNAYVPEIPHDLGTALLNAASQDWSQIDPSIFGTLFERVIDESKRAQLGAHYTSEADIMLIVEPVLMAPYREKWERVRLKADRLVRQVKQNLGGLAHSNEKPSQTDLRGLDNAALTEAHHLLADFAAELGRVRVLDPACGSGNFLYVALRELLTLQKAVITWAARRGLPDIELTVSPQQLYGIEINTYAHELAQITAWIGYLQWRNENGFGEIDEPILPPLNNIKQMDAILAYDADGNPVEPDWPEVDVIIGNPPFLGGKKIKTELGSNYVTDVFKVYSMKVSPEADLICYWFEKANNSILNHKANRVGLISTNSIRGGANRQILDRIKESGNIFMAWSDRSWILDGAAVRVSIIGFDDGSEKAVELNGEPVEIIHSDLTDNVNLGLATQLQENANLSFMGVTPAGSFDVDDPTARTWLKSENLTEHQNSDVVRPYYNGTDITRRPRNVWIVDFGVDMSLEEARNYQKPFAHVKENVYPTRQKNKRASYREKWWLLAESRSGMRHALGKLERYIGTSMVAKHRLFQWLDPKVLPANLIIVVARDDDYFFGVLHSKLHEMWALRMGTWLGKGNDPRYTPTTTFETYPFPWPPGTEPSEAADERVAEIAHWARALVAWRQAWLHPPRDGMYAGVGYDKMVKKRTLTNLYNGLQYFRDTAAAPARHTISSRNRMSGMSTPDAPKLFAQAQFDKVTRKSVSRAEIEELHDIHTALDRAVLDAYGWPHALTDEQILERLLALNLERAA